MKTKTALIITFQCCPNYGAVLQAYALKEYLKTLDLYVEILDYRPQSLMKQYAYVNTYSIASVIMSLYSLPTYYQKRRSFKHFQTNLNLTEKTYYRKEELNLRNIDYCFVGSDQIWNPDITSGFDPVYFGDIQWSSHPKIIAYAASIGKSFFTQNESKSFSNLIRKINCISMREEEAQGLVEKTTGLQSTVALDPTILVGAECFHKFVHKIDKTKYIFVYRLRKDSETLQVANEVAKRKGLKIIEISGMRKGIKKTKHKTIYSAGIEEFLSLLYHSDYVITDSFHGTAFSILFHKSFITIPHKTRGGRMKSLLGKVDLLDRMTSEISEDLLNSVIEWDEVDEKLKIARQKSQDYIKTSIYGGQK